MPSTGSNTAAEMPKHPNGHSQHLPVDLGVDDARDHELGVLLAQMRMANAQLAEFTTALHQVSTQLHEGDDRIGRIEAMLADHVQVSADRHAKTEAKIDTMAGELATNTATTQVVRDTVTTVGVVRRVLIWSAGIIGSCGAIAYGIWQALQVLGHRGPPGPTP